MSRLLLGLALLFGCSVLWTQPSAADGALAIALPSDVVKVGFAYGTGYNYPTAGEAQQKALENCKKTKSDVRKKLCAIIDIPRSRHNPKILWIDDAEIVGDRIT